MPDLKADRRENPVEFGEVYLHIGNSGFTFRLNDEGFGPSIHINAGAFGHTMGDMKIHTNRESLEALRDLIEDALTQEFSPTYCEPARVRKVKRLDGEENWDF